MHDTLKLAQTIADAQGWTLDTLLIMAIRYIESPDIRNAEDFLDWLQRRADDEDAASEPAVRYIAAFEPQRWDGDEAVDAEPKGAVEWDATTFLTTTLDLADADELRIDLLGRIAAEGEVVDGRDVLKDDPAAPQWIRDWDGPSVIIVRREEGDDADA